MWDKKSQFKNNFLSQNIMSVTFVTQHCWVPRSETSLARPRTRDFRTLDVQFAPKPISSLFECRTQGLPPVTVILAVKTLTLQGKLIGTVPIIIMFNG
jgi:hypothetical protein